MLPLYEAHSEAVSTYESDLGDSWQHECLLEKIMDQSRM